MDKLKFTLRILATNWVHLVGFYVATYFSLILFKLIGLDGGSNEGWNDILLVSLLTIPFLFFTYGIMIIIGFFGVVVILDIIGFNLNTDKIKLVLMIEWILIIPTFINWAFEYEYWLWMTLSISFLITQLLREKKIEKIIKTNILQEQSK